MLGVSCTGLVNFPDWLNHHPARKVILHRPLIEINKSMSDIGLPELNETDVDKLWKINGAHMGWERLFESPEVIYEFLLQKDFDPERHAQLALIEMQPKFSGLKINKEITRILINELRGI